MTEKRTHVGGAPIEYYEKRDNTYGEGVDVIGWYRSPVGVLKGTMCKAYCTTFATEADAEAVYGSMNWWNKHTQPSQSLSHLPGEDDPVPGGMYPDDI